MYAAIDIARYVVQYSHENNYPISNLRLQRLLYFMQANFINQKRNLCFGDEIECWAWGPTVPTVYREYRMYGSDSIPNMMYQSEFNFHIGDDKDLVVAVIEATKNLTPKDLIEISRNQDPWAGNYEPNQKNVIPIKSMWDFFIGKD